MRATRLPLRSLGPRTSTSSLGKPASSKRCAIALAAIVVLPTESVVLISISCLKMSCESCLVWGSNWAKAGTLRDGSSRQRVSARSRPGPATTKGIEFLFFGAVRHGIIGAQSGFSIVLRRRRPEDADYFPTALEWLARNFDCVSSFGSSSPFLFLSSLSNSASIKFMYSCLEILPFLLVSIRSSSCFTSFSPSASLSWGFGTDCFCAFAVPDKTCIASAKTKITHTLCVRIIDLGGDCTPQSIYDHWIFQD